MRMCCIIAKVKEMIVLINYLLLNIFRNYIVVYPKPRIIFSKTRRVHHIFEFATGLRNYSPLSHHLKLLICYQDYIHRLQRSSYLSGKKTDKSNPHYSTKRKYSSEIPGRSLSLFFVIEVLFDLKHRIPFVDHIAMPSNF